MYRASSEICQIRLDFVSFSLAQPSSEVRTDSAPNSRTECLEAQFTASSAGPAAPVLCGTNTGQVLTGGRKVNLKCEWKS